MFIQGSSCELPTLSPSPERAHSLLLGSVRSPQLKQRSKVNIATVPTHTVHSGPSGLFFWCVNHSHPSGAGSAAQIRVFLSAAVGFESVY